MNSSVSARTIIEIAMDVEAIERRIREVIKEAAERGDTTTIITVVDRWNTLPAVEVLSGDGPWSRA